MPRDPAQPICKQPLMAGESQEHNRSSFVSGDGRPTHVSRHQYAIYWKEGRPEIGSIASSNDLSTRDYVRPGVTNHQNGVYWPYGRPPLGSATDNIRALAFGKFCAVDVETTGVKRATSRVLQLALVLFDGGKPVGKRVWLFNPGVPIPPNATKVNRITNEMVVSCRSFKECAEEIRPLLERYPLVAHNLEFDTDMVNEEFDRIGPSLKISYGFCTMRRSAGKPEYREPGERRRPGEPRWMKLKDLANELGVESSSDLHDAYVDATLAGKCFVRMVENSIV